MILEQTSSHKHPMAECAALREVAKLPNGSIILIPHASRLTRRACDFETISAILDDRALSLRIMGFRGVSSSDDAALEISAEAVGISGDDGEGSDDGYEEEGREEEEVEGHASRHVVDAGNTEDVGADMVTPETDQPAPDTKQWYDWKQLLDGGSGVPDFRTSSDELESEPRRQPET